MKKIAILGPAYPLRGGLAAFNERLAQALQAQGHQVTIYTFSLQYPSILFPGKTQYSEDPAPDNLDIEVRMNSVNPLNWQNVGKHIARTKPEVLLVAFWLPFMAPCLGTICRIVRRKANTRIIGLVHNIIPHESRVGDKPLANYFVQSSDAFLVLSSSVTDDLRKFDVTKPINYAPHPIYDSYGKPVEKSVACKHLDLNPNAKYILFFGFIRAYKGLDLLLKAMQDKRVQALGIKLIIAGEFYENEADYRELIRDLDIQEYLILHTHFIPNSAVRYYFGAADLVVQPYKTATQSGISQLAYHFEKPMVVTNVGGLPEIVEDDVAGYVADVNAPSIANKIVSFYEEEKAAIFRKGVMEAKKRFSWTALTEQLEKLY